MAEVFREFDERLVDEETGRSYRSQVCGAEAADGRWEGWLEFTPEGGGAAVRTARETTQPNRTDLAYWSTGLTAVYLEGAFRRAIAPKTVVVAPVSAPIFERPAPPAAAPVAVLDPFSVAQKGEHVLRNELLALDAWHLRNIVRAHGLVDERGVDVEGLGAAPLIEIIVAATGGGAAATTR
jgi:hypothetical protein